MKINSQYIFLLLNLFTFIVFYLTGVWPGFFLFFCWGGSDSIVQGAGQNVEAARIRPTSPSLGTTALYVNKSFVQGK